MIKQASAAVGCLLLASLTGTRAAQATTAPAARSAATAPVTAYVATQYPNTVTPVRLATSRFLKPIRITSQPLDVSVTPDASTVVVVGAASVNRSSITLIHTATGKAFKTVKFTGFPWPAPIVFSRDSRTAYIANDAWSGTVIPLRTRTGRLGPPIRVGHDPVAMAITPDGKTVYVANEHSGTVTPIRTATDTALRPIRVGGMPGAVAITPDGKTAYVTSETTAIVTPIRTAANTALRPIRIASPGPYPDPEAIVITPDGKTAYVLDTGGVTPITIPTGRARRQIPVDDPFAGQLNMTPDGKIVYAVDGLYGILYPIRTATGTALRPIRFGTSLFGGVAFTPDSRFIYVASGGLLIPVPTATGKRGRAIRLPEFIESFAIAP
jgi:YVTN family beta-propeller protein